MFWQNFQTVLRVLGWGKVCSRMENTWPSFSIYVTPGFRLLYSFQCLVIRYYPSHTLEGWSLPSYADPLLSHKGLHWWGESPLPIRGLMRTQSRAVTGVRALWPALMWADSQPACQGSHWALWPSFSILQPLRGGRRRGNHLVQQGCDELQSPSVACPRCCGDRDSSISGTSEPCLLAWTVPRPWERERDSKI